MAPPKRGAAEDASTPAPKRRSSRQAALASSQITPVAEKVSGDSKGAVAPRPSKAYAKKKASTPKPPAPPKKAVKKEEKKPASTKESAQKTKPSKPKPDGHSESKSGRNVTPDPDPETIPVTNPDVPRTEGSFWLMKAEPESRFEDGHDVKFSIDDLRAKKKPEGWDGIRAYPARNNLRAMNAGDLAFFYHSNCKEPAIVGVMEIVREHSEDISARRPGTPYYDPSSTKEKPKWSLVHVEFRKKFACPITLKTLRELGQAGKPLEQMQMLKQSRLSVSKVNRAEWEAICKLADEMAEEAGLKHTTEKL